MSLLNALRAILATAATFGLVLQALGQEVSQGTGVVFNPDGHVLTNRHVVESGCGTGLWLEDIGGKRYRARILKVARTHDVALLQSEWRGPHAFFRVNESRNADIPPRVEDHVHIVGFPEGEFAFRGGFVSTLQDPRHGGDGFGIGLQTTFGGSGSPVFDDSGLLIGLIWAVRKAQDGSLRAYAVRADAIFPLLSEVRVGTATPRQAPHKRKQGQSWHDHIGDIVGAGAAITIKVFCAKGR